MTGTEERLSRGTIMALVAMAVGVFLVANDFTALSVAIPNIESDFDTTLNRAQWVINGYTVVFGVLIVTGGRLADLFGRKRAFLIGATVFAAFSLLAGFSPNIWVLIGSRALMGVGGALMWPAILGMTYAILPDSKAGLAGGLIIGVAGIGNATGPLIGGLLTDALSWRWVFFLNVPITIIAMAITARNVPETMSDVAERKVDYLGVATLSGAVIATLVALDQGTEVGFTDPGILLLFGVGIALLVVFGFVERGAGSTALVPPVVLRNRQFMTACLTILLLSAIFFASVVYLPQYMQKVLDYSALEAGAGLLPLMVVFAATSFVAGALYDRLGPKVVTSVGAGCLSVGMFALSFLDDASADGSGYAILLPGMLIVGAGIGLFYSSITTAGITALDASLSSLAGGIMYMCQIAGGSIGLGLNTAIVLSYQSFAEGISTAFLVDAALAAAGFLIALVYIGSDEPLTHRLHLRGHHRAHA